MALPRVHTTAQSVATRFGENHRATGAKTTLAFAWIFARLVGR